MPWFTDNAEAEQLAGIIFDLRRGLFLATEYHRAQEGVWETAEQEKRRERSNEDRLREWDNETRRIILHGFALTAPAINDDDAP